MIGKVILHIHQSPDLLQEAMDLFSSGEDVVDSQLKPTEASQEASVSVAEAENIPLPSTSVFARNAKTD